jgi:ribosomal protein S18 acetylase RimI-like enzyme
MLFHAAHMEQDEGTSVANVMSNPDLAPYVEDWGRETDLGFIATEFETKRNLGAAWVRLIPRNQHFYGQIDPDTPELAIAVEPAAAGKGIGTLLMQRLIDTARSKYPAIVLSVRADSRALGLYERFGFEATGEIVNRVGTKSYKMLLRF